MDLQNIQEQLNTEFAKDETRIIFWFDDKGDYSEKPNINDLMVSFIITYAASTLKATLPNSLVGYVLKKRNDESYLFVILWTTCYIRMRMMDWQRT